MWRKKEVNISNRIFTWKYDSHGRQIYVWDLIRTWRLNEIIWDNSAKVIKCPIWEVTLEDAGEYDKEYDWYTHEIDKSVKYWKREYFNVRLKETWEVLSLNNDRYFKKWSITSLHLSSYDWIFLWWWEEIEVVN